MPRFRWVLISLCMLLCACSAQNRMVKEPRTDLIGDVNWAVTGPDGVTITLHAVLASNSPGAWVLDADWDEYILTIGNHESSAISIERLQLCSKYLSAAEDSSLSYQQLEDRTRDTLKNVRDSAVIAGSVAVVGGATATVAAAGYAGTILAPAVGVLMLPLIGYEASRTAVRRNHEHQDTSLIQLTILERGIHLPLNIAAGGDATWSAFFPLTPAPSRLVMSYLNNGESRVLALPLPALARLHIKLATIQ